jgi:UDP-N-acetylmuramoyl-L-alanyl-D-glutamate--2,6-diaminopimelate ligase
MADGTGHRLSELHGLLTERGLAALPGADAAAIGTGSDPLVRSVVLDSRRAGAGALFAALPGMRADGRAFAHEAVARGAVAVLVEDAIDDLAVPQVVVTDARAALAVAAAWQAGFPSRTLGVVGVTGTDGKTTTAYLVRAALEAAGHRCGLVGTTEVVVGGRSLGNEARTTTPEAPALQGHLAAMRAAGDEWAVVETTSHGLAMQRVAEIAYDVGVLTNVTSEHLELHGTREAYVAAKRGLFARLAVGPSNPDKGHGKGAVINADDPEAPGFIDEARRASATVVTYGLADERAQRPDTPDVAAVATVTGPRGTIVDVRTPRWQGSIALRLPGRFNVANALAALGVAEALGLDVARAAEALEAVDAVPGRMQRIDRGQPFTVVVDYAHTAESLGIVLDELRPADREARLIAVFGSAGERDTQKRPEMGRAAAERCGLVVLTDEDPRGEDRMSILEAIADGARRAGLRDGAELRLVPDRAEAIALAMRQARAGDVVLLAGKGHERSIETAHGPVPWDEAGAAIEALEALGYRRA